MTGTRLWWFTNFNLDFDYEEYMKNVPALYLAYGDEVCPSTGRAHHQGWVYFKSKRATFKKVAKELGLHDKACGMCNGSIEDQVNYCSKDKSYHEFGTKPKQGARTDLDGVKDEIVNGKRSVDEITLENPILYHQYGRTLQKIEDIMLRRKVRTWMTEGIWYHGNTGVGKSHIAFENWDWSTHYLWKNDKEWQDGYEGQDIVIVNDFRGAVQYSELLQMVDKWPYFVSRRGKEPVPFLAKKVIITSSLRPEEVYKNLAVNDNIEQLLRRFEVIKLETKFDQK